MHIYEPDFVLEKIRAFPARSLIHRPTPLQPLDILSETLGGPSILMKREDLTGLAFGGNKSRKLEFIIADVLDQKADRLITWASLQSNWCLQTAAAARRFGIKPVLLLFKTYDLPEGYDGNLLLDFILDSEIHIHEAEKGRVVSAEYAEEILKDLEGEIRKDGHIPYVAPIGGSLIGGSMKAPLGAISYVNAFLEMFRQAESSRPFDAIVLASGSGGTQAGLIIGAKAVAPHIKVYGVSVSEDKEIYGDLVLRIAEDTREALGLDIPLSREDVIVLDEYIKEGYGIVNADVSRALRLVAESEGIFLDPVYTGKAMVGMIDLIGKKAFSEDSTVVFMHTGGTAALFPNKNHLVDFLST
jgi:L-cysteate sulfo-lyase